MDITILATIVCFLIGPGLWGFLYFATHMYTSDQIDDMEDRGEITWIQHTFLYERMMIGEYRLYPKLLVKLIPSLNNQEVRTK